MIRLFCAAELPIEVRERLAGLAGGVPGARWTPMDNMHLTLCFIGNVPESDFPDINNALVRVRAQAFDLAIEGAGHFARGRVPSMLWAGVAHAPALDHLQEKVVVALERAGFDIDRRKYVPHVTLARLSRASNARVWEFEATHGLLKIDPFTVDHFTLFSSFLGHGGAIYRAEARYPLARDGASSR
ncbi:MAG: 2'-5' RNA ligase [Alphaproteobacteria bacterium]|jgi:2'-5' RNA ligase